MSKLLAPNYSSFNFFLFLFSLFNLIHLTQEDYEKNCLEVQSCKIPNSNEIKCSKNGKCFYDLFDYLIKDKGKGDFFTCICNNGYITPNKTDYNSVFCCYKQKRQFYAFILEIIPGFGVGHYYAGRKTFFKIKLGVCVSLALLYIICHFLLKFCYLKRIDVQKANKGKKAAKNENELVNVEVTLNAIKIICLVGVIIFQIVDCILFGINYYHDGNGIELNPW